MGDLILIPGVRKFSVLLLKGAWSHDYVTMVWLEFSSSSTQLTVALSAGLGIGVLVGLLLARRRRKLPVGLVQTDSATTETVSHVRSRALCILTTTP